MQSRLTGAPMAFVEGNCPRPLSARVPHRHTSVAPRPDRRLIAVRAESGRKSSFSAGFVVGGVLCGVLGFLYAPQISKALLDEQQRLRVPRFLRDRSPRPVTREELIGKLDELHEALDQLSQDMDETKPEAKGAAESNGMADPEETKETPAPEPSS